MKSGDLVRVDDPYNDLHNRIGVVLKVDKTCKLFPNNRWYYEVLLDSGTVVSFPYEKLIESEDLYFTNDEYFNRAYAKHI